MQGDNIYFLGPDFIISSLLVIVILFSVLYFYRKRIFAKHYRQSNFELFIINIKQYLSSTYPKINFNFSIIKHTSKEQNPQTRAYSIINALSDQYISFQLDTNIQPKPIKQTKLWNSYTFNSKPNGIKLPDDWAQRKLVVMQRDNHICQRCSKYSNPENMHLHLLRSVKDGGQYYLENLIILCNDCEKIISKRTLKYLDIKDELNSFVSIKV